MAYTVPKLTDYSAAALEKAASECITACMEEAGSVRNEADLKELSVIVGWLVRTGFLHKSTISG